MSGSNVDHGPGMTSVGVQVVRSGTLDGNTSQTPGLPRRAAVIPHIHGGSSDKLWAGRVTGEPGMDSGPHHHGDAETVGYVLSGHFTLFYGDEFENEVSLGPGDFVYVGPNVPHIERNLSATEPVEFVTVRNPDNIVVSLD